MSKEKRVEAVMAIYDIISFAYIKPDSHDLDMAISSAILNELLKRGFLNEKVLVHADEVKDELDQAVFKCKVEE